MVPQTNAGSCIGTSAIVEDTFNSADVVAIGQLKTENIDLSSMGSDSIADLVTLTKIYKNNTGLDVSEIYIYDSDATANRSVAEGTLVFDSDDFNITFGKQYLLFVEQRNKGVAKEFWTIGCTSREFNGTFTDEEKRVLNETLPIQYVIIFGGVLMLVIVLILLRKKLPQKSN